MRNFEDRVSKSVGYIPPKERVEKLDKDDLVGENFIITGWRDMTNDVGKSVLVGIQYNNTPATAFLTGTCLGQLEKWDREDEFPLAVSLERFAPGKRGYNMGYRLVSADPEFAKSAADIPF